MSKDRKTRYFDFIEPYEERLNLIYRRWENQIAKQTAANKSRSLVSKLKSHKKATFTGIAIAVGTILTCQFGINRIAAWQNNRQLNATKTLIASNSQKLDRISLELENAAYQGQLACIQNGDIYQLTSGELNHLALSNEPRMFMDFPDTISLVRHSIDTQKPDAYLRLNPGNDLLFGSITETDSTLQSQTDAIDLNLNPEALSDRESVESYAEVQENAIALHAELSRCFGSYGTLGTLPPFPQFPYVD